MDIFADMGLTPEQGECLVANVGSVDMNDLTALMDLMTQCGISTDQLLQIGQEPRRRRPWRPTSSWRRMRRCRPARSTPPRSPTVFEIMGLDEATVDCLVEGEATAPSPTDDQSAEAVFIGCGVGPLLILDAIVALHEQTGATTAESTTTVAGGAGDDGVSSGNPMVDLLLEQLAAQGINLDATQGQCLLDNIADFDPNDMASVIAVLETCGIDIADLLPSG